MGLESAPTFNEKKASVHKKNSYIDSFRHAHGLRSLGTFMGDI